MKTDLSAIELRKKLSYDETNGIFTWKVKPNKRIAAGSVAGSFQKDFGYMVLKINNYLYKAHRLAWLYVYGKWPEKVIDHINGKKSDNRICNLRDVSIGGNLSNQTKPHRNGNSGFLGVTRSGDKYLARIRVHGQLHGLGTFDSGETAHAAYVAAKRKFHSTCTL